MRGRWAVIASVAAAVAGCGRPPLHVAPDARGVVIDVQTLGEYQTTVHRIRLTCGDAVIWEVVAGSAGAQIHKFRVHPGANPCYPGDVTEPEFRVVVPLRCSGFQVRSGERCEIEVWGRDSRLSRATASFTLREPGRE